MKWDKDSINALLLREPKAVERALLVLLERQTFDEVQAHDTKYQNGIGFTGADAEFMTSLALRVKQGLPLTPKQLASVTKTNDKGYCRLAKYHGQLIEEIEKKAKRKQLELEV
ncbi:hypothetical protein RCZAHN_98 [Rhodobacter phage RcZahn]|nr:hypothetical protein RCZAHN_98 [Rhodobacter phage RcZahn]